MPRSRNPLPCPVWAMACSVSRHAALNSDEVPAVGPGSDICLVIVSKSDEPPLQRARRARRCLRGVGVPLDILVKTRDEFDYFRPVVASLEHRVAEEGEVLYG